jgi:hypothetical protein
MQMVLVLKQVVHTDTNALKIQLIFVCLTLRFYDIQFLLCPLSPKGCATI